MTDVLERIDAFERESIALVADEVTPIPAGWVARTPSLPQVYSVNHVGVSVPIAAEDALALADRHMHDLPYRHLVIEHEPSGERLEDELRGRGWKVERNVLMALTREPARGVDTGPVIEVEEADALALMTEWLSEDEALRTSPEGLRQVVEATRLMWRARKARRFGVLGRDGGLGGMTLLFSDGSVAQVEDVYVVAAERGRGLGRMLVTHACSEAVDAGHEVIFIIGDDTDWPKQLYAQVGFDAVARAWEFHRDSP